MMGIFWILALGKLSIWVKRMVFFELLVKHVFLPDLFSLLDLMILVETFKCCILFIGFNIRWRGTLCNTLWMECALA